MRQVRHSIPAEGAGLLGDAHTGALLGWLRSLLAWRVDVTREVYGPAADDAYRGLYIADDEAVRLGADWPELPAALMARRYELAHERRAIERLAQPDAPLVRLARLFTLDEFARDVVLLALAPELDPRYEKLYAYIQDDVTRRRPTVALALQLFAMHGPTRDHFGAFAPAAPLRRHQLIALLDDNARQPTLPSQVIKLDERIVAELLGLEAIDEPLAGAVATSRPERTLDALVLPADLVAQLRRIGHDRGSGTVLALQGSYGSGRLAIAAALCAEWRQPLLDVDLVRLLDRDDEPWQVMRRIGREARLRGAAVFWRGADRCLGDDARPAWRAAFLDVLDDTPGCNIIALERAWEARGTLRRATFLRIELPALSYSAREQVWRDRLGTAAPDASALRTLASTFRLTPGQIRDAAAMAHALAHWRAGDVPLDLAVLQAACRAQSSGRLNALARKIATTYTWRDIVLPTDHVVQLREICLQVRQRRTVLEAWGFDRHLAMGKGVNVLFAGQSGTGKTMAAEIIAADLGLELYKVDLASMVSKYIGETEKNLDQVFAAAREANAILFFDEADAIFGKRSEVKDAHDRYANIEVGYLLQKMEEYDGVVILSTNLRKNLDDAFIRRLHVAIDFPFPEDADRQRIWEHAFPADAPRATDLDLAFLARRFRIAGGNIRNVALFSAFLAAEDASVITMRHVVLALRREYQKLGKLITPADFGEYYRQLETHAPAGA